MHDDLRAAWRSLRKSPTFTVVALTVLALGIGAGTAIFSVVDAVVLRALPFDEHDRLVAVPEHDTTRLTTFGSGATTPQTYFDWRRMQDSFDGMAYLSNTQFRLKNESGEPLDARGYRVTWEFFPMLRLQTLLGRNFTAEDEIEGRHRVVILSHGFWQRTFGGSRDVIGKTIQLSDESWEIVGVMPRWSAYPVGAERPTEIYAPTWVRAEDKVRGGSRNYNGLIVGRLRNGVSLQQAHEQMMALGATRRDVVAMVLKRATVLMALGLALGGLAAWYLSVTPRLGLKTYLFETTPTDAWIFAAALCTLALAGLAASAIPARRAASADPLIALRHE